MSANIEMRISNDVTFANTPWEQLSLQRRWRPADGPKGPYRVYIQFRDAVGNMSFVTSDGIDYEPALYIPSTHK